MSNIGFSYNVQEKTVLEICEDIVNVNKQLQSYTDDMTTYLSDLTQSQGYVRLSKNVLSDYKDTGDEYARLIMNEANKFYSLLNLTMNYDNNMIEATSDESQKFWKKFFSTTAMTLANLVEGAGGSVENMVDGGLVLTSYITDYFNWDSATQWLEDRIENKAVENLFNNLFENNEIFQSINENSLYKYGDTASKLFKYAGTAIGYIATAALVGIPTAAPLYLGTLGDETSDNLQAGMKLKEARAKAQQTAAITAAITMVAGPIGRFVSPAFATGFSHIAATGSTIYNGFSNPPAEVLTQSEIVSETVEGEQHNVTTENSEEVKTPSSSPEITSKPNENTFPEDLPWNDNIFDTNINNDFNDNNANPEYDYDDYQQYPEFDKGDNDMNFDNNNNDNNSNFDNNETTANNDFNNDQHYFWEEDKWNNLPETTDFVESIENQFNDSKNSIDKELSNSLSGIEEIVDLTQGVNIPTSTTPIKSTINTKNNNMTPLMAGLGAAVLAGLGTKAYLDNKSKKDEEAELEDWEEETIENENYKLDIEEKDYLTPNDEFAYKTEKYEASNISELPNFN